MSLYDNFLACTLLLILWLIAAIIILGLALVVYVNIQESRYIDLRTALQVHDFKEVPEVIKEQVIIPVTEVRVSESPQHDFKIVNVPKTIVELRTENCTASQLLRCEDINGQKVCAC